MRLQRKRSATQAADQLVRYGPCVSELCYGYIDLKIYGLILRG